MTRIKEFDSTGIAPLGRLYAGDLLAMQDAWADLTNLAQTISLGTLKIGETGLQLLRYGAGEARLTGMLRIDEILRGLGGIIGGTFTTTQRDAIAAGKAPYGLVILNTTTNQYEWNSGTDEARVWLALIQSSGDNMSTAWTPYTPATITGWTSTPGELDFSYLRIGTKTVVVNVHALGTVTNSVTTSFSTPALGNSVAGHIKYAAAYGVDEAAEVLVKMYVEAASATIKTVCHGSVNGWTTGTHAREVSGQIIYELA